MRCVDVHSSVVDGVVFDQYRVHPSHHRDPTHIILGVLTRWLPDGRAVQNDVRNGVGSHDHPAGQSHIAAMPAECSVEEVFSGNDVDSGRASDIVASNVDMHAGLVARSVV